jgi:hypothetical protein
MHFCNLDIALAELMERLSVMNLESELRVPASMVARVMTEFMVPSCTASDASSTLRLSRATESAMSISEVWKPFRASNSSSRHAVCRETWNRAGSLRAIGHHETRKGFVDASRSRG